MIASASYTLVIVNDGGPGPKGDTGDQGDPGASGTPAKVFTLKAGRSTFIRDRRNSTGSSVISLSLDVQGYSGTPSLSATAGTLSEGSLTVPLNAAPDSITVTATLQGAGTAVVVLSVIDETEYNMYWGELSSAPSGVIEGDHFLCTAEISGPPAFHAGVPYEFVAGSWAEMSGSDVGKMMNCLGGMLRSPNVQPTSGALFGWFRNLLAKDAVIESLVSSSAFIASLKAVSALFDSINVTGNSSFGGEITAPALKTQNSENSSFTLSASGGSASQGNANTVSAQGVLGSQVKANIQARVNALSDKTVYSASGSILGRSDFDKVMRISSVSSSSATLASKNGTSGLATESLSWTNTRPIPVKVSASATPKQSRESYTTYSVDWEYQYDTDSWASSKPPTTQGYTSNPEVGDTYRRNSNIAEDPEGGWTFTSTYYIAVENSETNYDYNTGSVTITNNGTVVSGSSFIVDSGRTLTITLSRPASPHSAWDDWSESSQVNGQTSITWKESDTFLPGILFIGSSKASFYLSDLSNGVYINSCSLAINGSTALNLTMGSAVAWTFDSSFGAIYKLVTFSWSNSLTGTATRFSGTPTASYHDSNGTAHSVGTLTTASYSPSSIAVSGTYSFTLSTSSYVSAYSISIAVVAQPKGVYAQSLYPQEDGQYDLGGTVNGVVRGWRNAYVGSLTAGSLIPGASGKTIGDSSNPWSSASINNVTGNVNSAGTGNRVYGAVFN